MKRKPAGAGAFWGRFWGKISVAACRQAAADLADRCFVKAGWLPDAVDGGGKVLHMSDTPTEIYGYLARLLRRVNPSVVVHTGDFSDNIKLELYPGEEARYEQAMRRLLNILMAPHRVVYLVMGNHDRADLLPPLPPRCVLCNNVTELQYRGVTFGISHYAESLRERPSRYNLFGHELITESYRDEQDRCFLNGVETMRLIDPVSGEVTGLPYPRKTDDARLLRRGRGR